jgi:RNA recognition motif-containing protein
VIATKKKLTANSKICITDPFIHGVDFFVLDFAWAKLRTDKASSRTFLTEPFFMAKTLYVGNLPFSASEDDVRSLFTNYGEVVSVKLIMDRETGRPRGFGFVEMNDGDAGAAIEALDGADFMGRALRVNEAQERAPRPKRAW